MDWRIADAIDWRISGTMNWIIATAMRSYINYTPSNPLSLYFSKKLIENEIDRENEEIKENEEFLKDLKKMLVENRKDTQDIIDAEKEAFITPEEKIERAKDPAFQAMVADLRAWEKEDLKIENLIKETEEYIERTEGCIEKLHMRLSDLS